MCKNLDFMSNNLFIFSLAITIVMVTAPAKILGNILLISTVLANEATAVNNAREHGGPVI